MKSKANNKLLPNADRELVEALAAIEHDQWMHWSQAVAADVPTATQEKWRRLWVAYAELSNDLKEADRVWARKVVNFLCEQKLIQSNHESTDPC